MRRLVPFASGLLFALGLGLAGMTVPAKVLAFLDFFGAWDPSLALVMAAALLVYLVVAEGLHRLDPIRWPARARGPVIDRPLIVGAALFGAGWGLAGLCPGPALVALAGGQTSVLVFATGMAAGLLAANRWRRADTSAAPGCDVI